MGRLTVSKLPQQQQTKIRRVRVFLLKGTSSNPKLNVFEYENTNKIPYSNQRHTVRFPRNGVYGRTYFSTLTTSHFDFSARSLHERDFDEPQCFHQTEPLRLEDRWTCAIVCDCCFVVLETQRSWGRGLSVNGATLLGPVSEFDRRNASYR